MFAKRTLLFVGLAVFMLVAGATWALAQGPAGTIYSCVNNSSGTIKIVPAGTPCAVNETALNWASGAAGGGGASVFAWQGAANINADSCFSPAMGGACGSLQAETALTSNGRLTALAILPWTNTVTTEVRLTVLVNGAETSLTAVVPANSTQVVIATGNVPVQAGDRITVKSHAIIRGPDPDPGGYPGPPGADESFYYNGSLEYRIP